MNVNYRLLQLTVFLGISLVASCTIRNKNLAGEQNIIQDTDWVLLSFADHEIPAAQNTRTSYIHFDSKNGKVKGFAGCNSFFGRYSLKGNRLSLQELGSTRASCPDMEVENYLMGIFDDVTTYSISGDLLTLYSKNTPVATFRAGYAEQPDHEVVPE